MISILIFTLKYRGKNTFTYHAVISFSHYNAPSYSIREHSHSFWGCFCLETFCLKCTQSTFEKFWTFTFSVFLQFDFLGSWFFHAKTPSPPWNWLFEGLSLFVLFWSLQKCPFYSRLMDWVESFLDCFWSADWLTDDQKPENCMCPLGASTIGQVLRLNDMRVVSKPSGMNKLFPIMKWRIRFYYITYIGLRLISASIRRKIQNFSGPLKLSSVNPKIVWTQRAWKISGPSRRTRTKLLTKYGVGNKFRQWFRRKNSHVGCGKCRK